MEAVLWLSDWVQVDRDSNHSAASTRTVEVSEGSAEFRRDVIFQIRLRLRNFFMKGWVMHQIID